ncbi:MAG: tetratricopeptide repeat protein [Bacteroidetes bacterium]|nr:tetratricopeptide repeat protein [Bacteroidota bacterium]
MAIAFNSISIKQFYAVNKKVVTLAGSTIVSVITITLFWSLYWHPLRESEAAAKLAPLHHYFEKDSFYVVLKGIKGKKMMTAPEIADSYFLTDKSNEAAMMAGLAYMQTGKFEKAISYLEQAEPKDQFLSAGILSARAHCYSELGKPDKAADLYAEAGSKSSSEFSAQYWKNAGIHYEKAESYSKALDCYEKIKNEYSSAAEASDIDKYISKVKALQGDFNP